MNIVSYNCFNFKSNHLMIKKLIDSNDIYFFIEHWLGNAEDFLFTDLCSSTHDIIFQSNFNEEVKNTRRKGRPFCRKCWIIQRNLTVKSFENLSEVVSKLVIQTGNSETFLIYGLWIPFDDNTPAKLGILHSTFSLFEAELSNNANVFVVVMGDFSCDLKRKKLSIFNLKILFQITV